MPYMEEKQNLVTIVYRRRCGKPNILVPKMNQIVLICTSILLMCTIVWYLSRSYTNEEILNYSLGPALSKFHTKFTSHGRYVIGYYIILYSF